MGLKMKIKKKQKQDILPKHTQRKLSFLKRSSKQPKKIHIFFLEGEKCEES